MVWDHFINASYQNTVLCIISTKVISAHRGKFIAFCHFLFTPPSHSLKDIAVKSISSFAMMTHQPSLASQLGASCPAGLLESLVQNEQGCEGEEGNRKPIWTPSALGKQSQILHGAVEPGLGSHPRKRFKQCLKIQMIHTPSLTQTVCTNANVLNTDCTHSRPCDMLLSVLQFCSGEQRVYKSSPRVRLVFFSFPLKCFCHPSPYGSRCNS